MTTDTKTAILDSAEAVARHKGFDGFSYADLAKEVGIRKASIHYHFPSKAELSIALVRRYRSDFLAASAGIDKQHTSAASRMQSAITYYREALKDGTSLCLCVALSVSRESLAPEVLEEITAFRASVTNWLKRIYEQAQDDGTIRNILDPELEAQATLPLLEGAQLAARTECSLDFFDTALQLLKSRINQS